MVELHQHVDTLQSFQKLVDVTKTMPKEITETFLPNPLFELHKSLHKILTCNHIITVDRVEEQQKITKIIDSMGKVQLELVKQ